MTGNRSRSRSFEVLTSRQTLIWNWARCNRRWILHRSFRSSERLTERMSEESKRNELGVNHSSLHISHLSLSVNLGAVVLSPGSFRTSLRYGSFLSLPFTPVRRRRLRIEILVLFALAWFSAEWFTCPVVSKVYNSTRFVLGGPWRNPERQKRQRRQWIRYPPITQWLYKPLPGSIYINKIAALLKRWRVREKSNRGKTFSPGTWERCDPSSRGSNGMDKTRW